MVRQIFVKERMEDLQIFEKYSQKLIKLIDGHGQPTDVQDLFFRYTLDVSTEFMFGDTVGSLDDPQAEFTAAISDVQEVQAVLARSGYVRPLENRLNIRLIRLSSAPCFPSPPVESIGEV